MESMDASDIFVNGEVRRGRSKRYDDGTYAAYDLMEARPSDSLVVLTETGAHELVKATGEKYDSALENWRLPAEEAVGSRAVRLTLLEADASGASFLTPSVVLSQGMELGVTEDDKPLVIKSLGVVAGIACRTAKDVEAMRQPQTA